MLQPKVTVPLEIKAVQRGTLSADSTPMSPSSPGVNWNVSGSDRQLHGLKHALLPGFLNSKFFPPQALLLLLLALISHSSAALDTGSQPRVAAHDSMPHLAVTDDATASHDDSSSPRSSAVPTYRERRFSFGIRGGLSHGEHDLRLTTNQFPNYYAGVYGEFRLGSSQRLRSVAEWWSFRQGVQRFRDSSEFQLIDTRVQAEVAGGEYLYNLGGPVKRISLGVGGYAARWSVDSVNTITLFGLGTARASGNSHWIRPAGSAIATFRTLHSFELMGRWVYSTYGFERVPVSVVTFGAGWTF